MTRRIEGIVCTRHADPECVAEALSSDNLEYDNNCFRWDGQN